MEELSNIDRCYVYIHSYSRALNTKEKVWGGAQTDATLPWMGYRSGSKDKPNVWPCFTHKGALFCSFSLCRPGYVCLHVNTSALCVFISADFFVRCAANIRGSTLCCDWITFPAEAGACACVLCIYMFQQKREGFMRKNTKIELWFTKETLKFHCLNFRKGI